MRAPQLDAMTKAAISSQSRLIANEIRTLRNLFSGVSGCDGDWKDLDAMAKCFGEIAEEFYEDEK